MAPSTEYAFPKLNIKGCVFSMFSSMGPDPIFFYPLPADLPANFANKKAHIAEDGYLERNYMQIAVKSISLLLSDYSFDIKGAKLEDIHIFGVLPYPDINSIAFTYFTYFYSPKMGRYMPTSFSILVTEHKRTYIYDNVNRLRTPMRQFTEKLIKYVLEKDITSNYEANPYWEEILPDFVNFFNQQQSIQEKPLTPITKNRRIKILFTGLENTGKSSFLLMLNRRFSEVPSLIPTTRPLNEPFNFLGTTIVKWDIPGQEELRKAVLEKSELYLFETDVLYYFIDITNPRIEESKLFLQNIMDNLQEYECPIPIIFIITKIDEDITHKQEIRELIEKIKTEFIQIINDRPYRFFETSIFSSFSILNAFSYGIRQLSPNREMLEHLIWEFLIQNNLITGLLVNKDGLVLAAQEIIEPEHKFVLSRNQIFELTASNFTSIAQQFTDYIPSPSDTTLYHFSEEDVVYLKRFQEDELTFYFLFYSKRKEAEHAINENFNAFVEKIRNLLHFYLN